MNRRKVGSCYEDVAAAYLTNLGYQIKEHNFKCRAGEIDLIANHEGYLVFIEVKYRKNLENGSPLEAVTLAKQRRIQNTARYYLYSHGYSEEFPCRFDVVGILEGRITLIKNAF